MRPTFPTLGCFLTPTVDLELNMEQSSFPEKRHLVLRRLLAIVPHPAEIDILISVNRPKINIARTKDELLVDFIDTELLGIFVRNFFRSQKPCRSSHEIDD